MTCPVSIAGLEALLDDFDVFLVDQFGVLHDGSAPYPGAVDALKRLKAAGKRVILLSNSGRRVGPNVQRATSLGFAPDSYDEIISSGEVAWHLLKEGRLCPSLRESARCLLFARDGDSSAIDGLGLQRTQNGSDADLVLISGSEGERFTLDDYRAMLEPAAARGVPAICSNPDKIMLTPVGPRFGAGQIGELYESLGGQVTWVGKPYPDMYRFAFRRIGDPAARIVAIGDSVEHDVAGGKAAGIATVFVRGGILADAGDAELAALFARYDANPDYMLPRFTWR